MVPKFEEFMLPLLEELMDGGVRSRQEVFDAVAKKFNLTEEQKVEMLSSGKQTVYENRLAWAGTYLNKAKLLSRPRRGFLQITEKGQAVLHQKPERINIAFLSRFPEFNEFRTGNGTVEETDTTPQEDLERGFQKIAANVRDEILERLHEVMPTHFEQIVIDVLVAMGYGGSHEDAAKAVGKSGDGGIDGVINEDRLGLDTIYVQAKRWKSNIGRPEIQSFVGALSGRHSNKGIFITTSSFTAEALDYAKTLREKIILIDGDRLAGLMYEFNVGVSVENIYSVKRVDTDYFLLT